MGLFKFNYDGFTLDQFTEWSYDMWQIGLSVSAYPGDYGKATCLNCRAVIDIGVPRSTGFEYGIRHRKVCGDQNLSLTVKDGLLETVDRLSVIGTRQ